MDNVSWNDRELVKDLCFRAVYSDLGYTNFVAVLTPEAFVNHKEMSPPVLEHQRLDMKRVGERLAMMALRWVLVDLYESES